MTDRRVSVATALIDLLGQSSVLTRAEDMHGYTEDWRGRDFSAATTRRALDATALCDDTRMRLERS